MYSIYVHTTPDGRKYVGSTSQENPNKRFGGGRHYKHNTRFLDAIKLFGWDNIEHQVLETVEDKETAFKREEYYTLLWRTNEPEFGYNIYVCHAQNEETKNKRSESLKGRKQSEDTINKRVEKNKKHIIMKNINTGEIIEFDSRISCAEFFGVTGLSLHRFIKGKRTKSKTFKDYEVLSK